MKLHVTVALAALAFIAGCKAPCDDFKKDPTKYDFQPADGSKPQQREAGPFVIAVYCKGPDKEAVRDAIDQSLKDAGGGSASDLKDEGGNYHNFARWVPYSDQSIAIQFETKFTTKESLPPEGLELIWKGTAKERPLEINKLDPQGKPVPGYPTLAEKGGKNVLKVPMEYIGDPKNSKTLIAMNKLEERATGGFKFKGALPFAIKDKAKGAEVPIEKWDGTEDVITPESESILFFTISGFKGDSRDLQCALLRQERSLKDGKTLDFQMALANLWLKATGGGGAGYKTITASGEITGVSGQVTACEAKLPEGFPSPSKKYESRSDLDGTKDPQVGDFFIQYESDEQANKVTFSVTVRLPVGKDPQNVVFHISVKDAAGKQRDYDRTVPVQGGSSK